MTKAPKTRSSPLSDRFRTALFCATVLVLAGTKMVRLGVERGSDLWLDIAFDSCLWAWLWLACEGLARVRRMQRFHVPELLLTVLLLFSAGLSFAHTWFFDAAVERRLTVLDMTLAGTRYFFSDALPSAGYGALAATVVALVSSTALFARRIRPLPIGPSTLVIAGATAITILFAARAPRVPSPMFDTAAELWELAATPRVLPAREPIPEASLKALDKSASGPSALDIPFKKVVVIVMETMTQKRLVEETAQLAASAFFRRAQTHAHRYLEYYPNNQDSRTGMLDLLGSRLIPYEAYSDEGVRGYRHVSALPSLVGRLKALDYRTAFAVSQIELEEIVTDLPWDEQLHLTTEDIAQARKDKLCFEPDEYEHSCEDLALLPKVLEFLTRHARAFVFQEMIWGHASEYNSASGKTNTAYYAEYTDALIAGLSARGLLDETLIVLTSDHGFRDKSLQARLDVLRIPLWFYATRFQGREDRALRSHVDFKDLLFAELQNQRPQAGRDPLVMIIGPTDTGHLTVLTNRSHTLIKERFGTHLLLEHGPFHAASARPAARDAPARYLALFERYRRAFHANSARTRLR